MMDPMQRTRLAVERATESRGGRREERHHELLRHRSSGWPGMWYHAPTTTATSAVPMILTAQHERACLEGGGVDNDCRARQRCAAGYNYAGQIAIDSWTLSSTYPDFYPTCGDIYCGNTCCVPCSEYRTQATCSLVINDKITAVYIDGQDVTGSLCGDWPATLKFSSAESSSSTIRSTWRIRDALHHGSTNWTGRHANWRATNFLCFLAWSLITSCGDAPRCQPRFASRGMKRGSSVGWEVRFRRFRRRQASASILPRRRRPHLETKILRRVRAESSRRPPRHRRDACSMAWRCRFLAARPSQDGRVIAEK